MSSTPNHNHGLDRFANTLARNAPPEILERLRQIRQDYRKKTNDFSPPTFPPKPGSARS